MPLERLNCFGILACEGVQGRGVQANGDLDLMSAKRKEAEYRRYAGALVDLASRAGTVADKFRLLAMAHDWLKLADKMARLTRRSSHDPFTGHWERHQASAVRRNVERD